MTDITVDVKAVDVNIDGILFRLPPHTIKLEKDLMAVSCKNEYEAHLKQLELLIGADGVAKVFPKGDDENIDRIAAIHAGVMNAFTYNVMQIRMEQAKKAAEAVKPLAETLQPLLLAESLKANHTIIKKNDHSKG